jgi:cell division protein FtsW (lipid II flippase)
LWLVLPESARQELSTARQSLNARTQIMTYGCLYTLVSLIMLFYNQGTWWAPLAGLLVVLCSYYIGMLPAAETYGNLMRTVYAVHRFDLYRELAWPLPNDDAKERKSGEQINIFLSSGIAPSGFFFKHKDKV